MVSFLLFIERKKHVLLCSEQVFCLLSLPLSSYSHCLCLSVCLSVCPILSPCPSVFLCSSPAVCAHDQRSSSDPTLPILLFCLTGHLSPPFSGKANHNQRWHGMAMQPLSLIGHSPAVNSRQRSLHFSCLCTRTENTHSVWRDPPWPAVCVCV